jgi:hypothetical protein
MNLTHRQWQRLTAAVRRAPEERSATAPYGFATRVAARAFAVQASSSPLLERFALRAFGLACLLAMLGVAANYSLLRNNVPEEDRFFITDDPAAILLDVS